MAMSAVRTRGELVGSRATGGFALAFKANALLVTAGSELLDGTTGRLNASRAGVTRVRTALAGSRGFTLGGGRLSLTPSVEVGLRRDGGDAETDAGMDVSGGLAFTDTVTGLSLDVGVRTLLVHQAKGVSERGVTLAGSCDPTPSTPLSFTTNVAPSWGGEARGGAGALWGRETMAEMAHGSFAQGNRLDDKAGTTGSGVLDRVSLDFELSVDAQWWAVPATGCSVRPRSGGNAVPGDCATDVPTGSADDDTAQPAE